MPLIHGKSNKAFSHNVSAEMHAGKPQKQAVAIAYAVKRRAQHNKMGHGGTVEECPACMWNGGSSFKEGGEVLDANARKHIAKKNFGLPSERKYPIEDRKHAQNALSRVSQFGSPAEKAEVRGRVEAKYPTMGEAEGGEVERGEDAELMEHCAGELCEAMEKKDKKAVVEAMRALMLAMKE